MNCEAALNELLAADRHQGGLRCARLFELEPSFNQLLAREVAQLCRGGMPSDVGDPMHVTHWVRPYGRVQQYSLLNRSGRTEDYSDDHSLERMMTFARGAEFPSIACLRGLFRDAVNLRLAVMGPRAGLSPHEEHLVVRLADGDVGVRVRLHLPIVTNADAEIVLDGDVHHLERGAVYFVNHGCVHSARNRGGQARIHLVWDVLLTESVCELLFGSGDVPSPLHRVPAELRIPPPQRRERMGAYRRLPSTISADEARRARFADPV